MLIPSLSLLPLFRFVPLPAAAVASAVGVEAVAVLFWRASGFFSFAMRTS
jgi:hypothetical protein